MTNISSKFYLIIFTLIMNAFLLFNHKMYYIYTCTHPGALLGVISIINLFFINKVLKHGSMSNAILEIYNNKTLYHFSIIASLALYIMIASAAIGYSMTIAAGLQLKYFPIIAIAYIILNRYPIAFYLTIPCALFAIIYLSVFQISYPNIDIYLSQIYNPKHWAFIQYILIPFALDIPQQSKIKYNKNHLIHIPILIAPMLAVKNDKLSIFILICMMMFYAIYFSWNSIVERVSKSYRLGSVIMLLIASAAYTLFQYNIITVSYVCYSLIYFMIFYKTIFVIPVLLHSLIGFRTSDGVYMASIIIILALQAASFFLLPFYFILWSPLAMIVTMFTIYLIFDSRNGFR